MHREALDAAALAAARPRPDGLAPAARYARASLDERLEERCVLALLGVPEHADAQIASTGSSSASSVPSSAHADSTSPSPTVPNPWWWCDLTGARSPSSVPSAAAVLHLDLVVGEHPGRVLVLLVADDLGQVLDEIAAARDVQHLRAAAHREHRHVALERRVEQRELAAVSLRRVPIVSGCASWPYSAGSMSAAAGEEDPVERVERLLDPLVARGHEQRPPAGRARSSGRTRAGSPRPGRPRRPSARSARRTR